MGWQRFATVTSCRQNSSHMRSKPTGATLAAGAAIGTITNDDAATPAPGVSSVVHTVNDDWGSGHVADITLTAGHSGINGWTLELDAPIEITNAWNAEILSSTDGHHVLRNAAWNGVLGAGQQANPGYQATPGGAAATVTNFKINGVAVGHSRTHPAAAQCVDWGCCWGRRQ